MGGRARARAESAAAAPPETNGGCAAGAPGEGGRLAALLAAEWRRCWPERPLQLSARRRAQLGHAERVLQRLGQLDDAERELRDLIAADAALHDPPRSAGLYVLIIRKRARTARRAARGAGPARPWTALSGKEQLW